MGSSGNALAGKVELMSMNTYDWSYLQDYPDLPEQSSTWVYGSFSTDDAVYIFGGMQHLNLAKTHYGQSSRMSMYKNHQWHELGNMLLGSRHAHGVLKQGNQFIIIGHGNRVIQTEVWDIQEDGTLTNGQAMEPTVDYRYGIWLQVGPDFCSNEIQN